MNERQREQVNRANRARHKAVQRLIDRHRAEYDRLYAEEAGAVGVTPAKRLRERRLRQAQLLEGKS